MTSESATAGEPMVPPHDGRFLWWRVATYWFVLGRAWWRALVAKSFGEPLLYLFGLGFGLGALVDDAGRNPGGVPYAAYVAAGVLAGSAAQSSFGEAAWPVLGAVKWQRQYFAQLAAPPRVSDVLLGHLIFMTVRLLVTIVPFWLVMAAFALVSWPSAPLAVPAALLTGLALTTPVAAYAATAENDYSFALLLRFVVTPMFLFSGAFFPVTQLPGWLQPAVWVNPVWHGVELSRAASLGQALPGLWVAGHVGYLLLLVVGGFLAARVTYRRRLT